VVRGGVEPPTFRFSGRATSGRGLESTVSRERTSVRDCAPPGSDLSRGSDIGTELLLKRGTLVGAEPAHTTRFLEAKPFHDLLCPDLAHARQGLK
jgi:hypothetical protein